MASSGTNVTAFVDVVGDYFASYYTRNDSWTVSASSISSLLESMTEILNQISLAISAIAAISLLVGGRYRRHEHHDGFGHRAYP